MHLSPNEIRVLGSLIEKEITTPEYYPLSRNALQAAANQRSSRDPVLTLSEEDVLEALQSLEDRGLVTPNRGSRDTAAARVPKYEHRARTLLNLRRDETALLCLLLLRGPQTPGELRSRSDRLHTFDDLAAVIATLDRLAARPPRTDADAPITPDTTGPLVTLLPRHPGSREARYAHLLGDDPISLPSSPEATTNAPRPDTLSAMQAELLSLRSAIAALEARVASLEGRRSSSSDTE